MSGGRPGSSGYLGDRWFWLPFAAVGVLMGVLTVLRFRVGVPVADATLFSEPLIRFETSWLPGGGSVVETKSGSLHGLKLPVLGLLLGHIALSQVVLAVGTGVACSRAIHDEWVPSASVLGSLVAYGVAAGCLWMGAVMFTVAVPAGRFVVGVVAVVIPLVLFLTPAVIVAEERTPGDAIRRAVALFRTRIFRTLLAALVVTNLGHFLTVFMEALGSRTVLNYGLTATFSTAVGGTVYVAVMVASYLRASQLDRIDDRRPVTTAQEADD